MSGDEGVRQPAPASAAAWLGEPEEEEPPPSGKPMQETTRARGHLLSTELMDVLGHGEEDGTTTPVRGMRTPEIDELHGSHSPDLLDHRLGFPQANTPTPHQTPQMNAMADPWDWKTDVPDFVPGSRGASKNKAGPMGGTTPAFGATSSAPGAGPQGGQSIWTVTAPAAGVQVAAIPWGTLVPVAPGGSGSAPGGCGPAVGPASTMTAGGATDAEANQLRAQYEWQVRRQDEELRTLQQRMQRLEQRRTEVKEGWDRERQDLVRELARYAAVLTRYAIPLEEACGEGGTADQPWTAPAPAPASSLDAKMRRLNGLLVEDTTRTRTHVGATQPGPVPVPPGPTNSAAQAPAKPAIKVPGPVSKDGKVPVKPGQVTEPMPAGSIASTLQAMFPHATIRTQAEKTQAENQNGNQEHGSQQGPPQPPQQAEKDAPVQERYVGALADPEVADFAEKLERETESLIDDRALRALQALLPAEATEVLTKVDDLVQAQGGRCRNLSSILQSVCRKLERRSSGRGAGGADGETGPTPEAERAPSPAKEAPASGSDESDEGTGRKRRTRARRKKGRLADSDGEEDEDDDDEGTMETPEKGDGDGGSDSDPATRKKKRERRKKKKNPDDDDDDDSGDEEVIMQKKPEEPGKKTPEKEPLNADGTRDYWNVRRIERVATRGFELKKRADRWELKLAMGGLDPPMSEAGMERYCQWLRARLQSHREEHGGQSLRKCTSEIDFSNNSLGNQSIWMLLESLAQYEVHAASLKLYKNRISQAGVLAMCEFIRANRRAGPVYEMHLSHNDIDDESALELLRTLREQRQRYPPRRPTEDADGNPTGNMAPVPVWVRLNQNRIRDPPAALRVLETEGITFCAARNAHGCGPGKCARPDCPLVHLYLFADQAPRQKEGGDNQAQEGSSLPAAGGGGGGDNEEGGGGGSRRKRGRKARGSGGGEGGEDGKAANYTDKKGAGFQ